MSQERIQGQLGRIEALRRLWRGYLRKLWAPILLGVLCTVGFSSVNLGYGKLVHQFLSSLQAPTGGTDFGKLNYYVVLALLLYILRGLFYFVMQYSSAYAGQKLSMRLREEIYRHLQRMSVAFYDHKKTGFLISCVDNDVQVVNQVLEAIQDFISAPFVLIGGTILLFWLNWQLALVSILALPPTAWIIITATRKARYRTTQLQSGRAYLVDLLQETITGIRVVRAFGNEEHEIRRFCEKSSGLFKNVLKTARIKAAVRPLVEIVGAMTIMLVLWVAGHQIVANRASFDIPKLIWFVMVLQQVADAAKNSGSISVNMTIAAVAADRIFTLLDCKSEIVEKPGAIELKEVRGRVEFDRVDFAYSSGIPVLKDISFTMSPGEVVALVGPTGAGKTTIASLIPRFYDVSAGAIRVDGVDVRDCTIASLRRVIGIVPQETQLFSGTLRDNIAYGRLDATHEEIVEAAKLANAWEFIKKLPHGLNTVVGERGLRLSGGQRQRIAIARAILRNPRILILDEATSSLDARSERLVQDALQKLTTDRTTLVIAHRLSTIRNADRILVIRDGRIVEAGRHEELMALGGAYQDLYRTQFRWQKPSVRRAALEQ